MLSRDMEPAGMILNNTLIESWAYAELRAFSKAELETHIQLPAQIAQSREKTKKIYVKIICLAQIEANSVVQFNL